MRNKDYYSYIRVACALYFGVFTFCYLYFFQADIMCAAQHVLSKGQTHYDRTLGALLITAVLFLVQLATLTLTRFTRRWHWFTYAPSLYILAILTSFSEPTNNYLASPWYLIVLVLLFVVLFLMRKVVGISHGSKASLFSPKEGQERGKEKSLLFLILMTIIVGFVGNGNDVLHYRLRMERCLIQHDYRAALEVGRDASVTDTSLTMLRIYALSCVGQLPDGLSNYPVAGNAETILPDGRCARTIILNPNVIFNHVGIPVKEQMPATQYLSFIRRTHKAKLAADGYEHCAKELKKMKKRAL